MCFFLRSACVYTNNLIIFTLFFLLTRIHFFDCQGSGVADNTGIVVTHVTPETLNEYVSNYNDTVIEFYATWCNHCKLFTPIFNDVAKLFPSSGFGSLNGGIYRSLAAEYVNDEFPGVALFSHSKFVDYMRGPKTREFLTSWLEQRIGEPIEICQNLDDAAKKQINFRVSFVGIFPSPNTLAFQTYKEITSKHREWGRYFAVFNHTLLPSTLEGEVFIKHPYEARYITHSFEPKKLEEWLEFHRFPLFGIMDSSNQHEYYKRGKDPVIFLGNENEFKLYWDSFRKAAIAFREYYSFVWFDTNASQADDTLRSLGVRKTPTFVVFYGTGNHREHKRFIFDVKNEKDLLSHTTIIEYIQNIRDRKIGPAVKSSSYSSPEAAYRKHIRKITGLNFESEVLTPDKDVIIVLTAPKGNDIFKGCINCNPLLDSLNDLYQQIINFYGTHPVLLSIGEFVVTDNEIPLYGWGGNWTLQQLPVIYFVEAATTFPIEYYGPMDRQSILLFWEEHTHHPIVKKKKLSNQSLETNKTYKFSANDEL